MPHLFAGSLFHRRLPVTAAIVCLCLFGLRIDRVAAGSLPQVELNANAAGPRAIENLTAQAISENYRHAWQNLSEALDSNSSHSLDLYFGGTARAQLGQALAEQERTGLRSRYLNQDHKLEAVFYAPEGDVMELHDTTQCEIQVLDGGKVIHDEQAVLHYVVLMTPAADRWVIRQLQAVHRF